MIVVHPACEWRALEFIQLGFWLRCRRGKRRSYLILTLTEAAS